MFDKKAALAASLAEPAHVSRILLYVEQNKPTKAMASYLMTQCVLGCLIGLVWGLLIFATDTAGIRDLVSASSYPAATFVLFLLGSIIAILPVVLATAIGRLAE